AEFAKELLATRVPPGVDDASYVKAAFLAAVAKGEAASPLISKELAVEMLGKMVGGYNVASLVTALDDPALAPIAAKELSNTILMFDAKFDVEEKFKAGNAYAKQVMESWANAEWFTSRGKVPEKYSLTVFKYHALDYITHSGMLSDSMIMYLRRAAFHGGAPCVTILDEMAAS
ncbi:unnamed protein product, partial [Prorocentrum cordatum]